MIERDSELFKKVERNYWQYYKELEKEFIKTRKYVEFDDGNNDTFSIEYLKLFLAVCSEIDVVGKTLATIVDSSLNSKDMSTIYKWWYYIQDECEVTSSVSGHFNNSLNDKPKKLYEFRVLLLDSKPICPWEGFRVERFKAKNGSMRYRKTTDSKRLQWWNDYNKVKHTRFLMTKEETEDINYRKANLGNLSCAFAALYALELSLLECIGTRDDLEAFADISILFDKEEHITSSEMDRLLNNVF